MVVTRTMSSSLPSPLPVRDVVLDHPHVPCLVPLQCPAAPGRGDQRVPFPAGDPRGDQDGPVGAIGQHLQHRQPGVLLHPPQQGRPGIRRRAPVLPGIEVPVGDHQPVLFQPRVQLPGHGLLPAALAAGRRAHHRQHRGVRAALADRHHPDLRERRLVIAPHPEDSPVRVRVRTSHSIPSTDISRHGPRNAPAVSRSATGAATCENTCAIGSGPSRLRA